MCSRVAGVLFHNLLPQGQSVTEPEVSQSVMFISLISRCLLQPKAQSSFWGQVSIFATVLPFLRESCQQIQIYQISALIGTNVIGLKVGNPDFTGPVCRDSTEPQVIILH